MAVLPVSLFLRCCSCCSLLIWLVVVHFLRFDLVLVDAVVSGVLLILGHLLFAVCSCF